MAVLQRVYDDEGIDYRLDDIDEAGEVKRIQVADEDITRAQELLDQTGFQTEITNHSPGQRRIPGNKWIFIFFAAFMIILVAMLILMFMNVD